MMYPNEVVRVMGREMQNIKRVIGFHFKNRHDGRTSAAAKNWIAEYRRLDNSSGYTKALKLMEVK